MCKKFRKPYQQKFPLVLKFVTPYPPKLPHVLICHGCVKPAAASGITLLGMRHLECLLYFCGIPIA